MATSAARAEPPRASAPSTARLCSMWVSTRTASAPAAIASSASAQQRAQIRGQIDAELRTQLQKSLIRSHAAGMGQREPRVFMGVVTKMQFTAEVGSGEQLRGALSHLLEVNGVFEVRRR